MQPDPQSKDEHRWRRPGSGDWRGIVRATGLVFGDIGTSPIYTLTVIFLILPSAAENIVGVVSLILWTLIAIVFGQYLCLAMKLDHDGEGGTLILRRIAGQYLRPGRWSAAIGALAFIGAALLLGDGVITPAISILSAVEGIRFIPQCAHLPTAGTVGIAVAITAGLFLAQREGSDRMAAAFGPVMVLWFIALGATGMLAIMETPAILKAINPWHALRFCWQHGLASFFILAQVVLCVTGAEALYADMGQAGKPPIVRACGFVFPALALSYLGQGAFLMHKPEAHVLLFEMVRHQCQTGYLPFLLLSILATVIASQSLISGAFSIIFQAISMGSFPPLRIDFTSSRLKTQIYIGAVNWTLMASVIFMMIYFRESASLGAAYGLAVTGTMAITTLLMAIVYFYQKARLRFAACLPLFLLNIAFFGSCLTKLPTGGYWSLLIASVPLVLLTIWSIGEARLAQLKPVVSLDEFLPEYAQRHLQPRLPGTAVYSFVGQQGVPPYVRTIMFQHGIMYDRNIFFSVVVLDKPYGFRVPPLRRLADKLYLASVEVGYMELKRDLKLTIENMGSPRVIFYGIDRVDAKRPRWVPYAVFKRLTLNYTSHFHVSLPPALTHGVIHRVDMA